VRSLIVLLVLGGIAFAVYQAAKSAKEESQEGRTIESLPPTVRHAVVQLDRSSQAALFNEYEQKKRKLSVAYVAWFLLGWHYLYLRKVGVQFAFWFTLGGFWIWWFVDLFRMPSIVRSCNEQIAREALQTLGIGQAFRNTRATDMV
jgi:TM2 domain-containing membrane protein YozV